MSRYRKIFSFLPFFLLIPAGWVRADDHVMVEMVRTYMGNISKPRQSEKWISAQRVYSRTGGPVATLTCYDLGKVYTIHTGTRRYLEEPLPAGPKPAAAAEGTRIQEAGFNYEPVFQWEFRDTGEEKVIEGRPCRHFILTGDADYAEEIRHLWITSALPVDLPRYWNHHLRMETTPELAGLYRQHPEIRQGLAQETKILTENAVAPAIEWNIRLILVETADPPAGLYEVPAGYKQVPGIDQLYQE